MSVLYVLVPVALVFAALWIALFAWCVRHGQFDEGTAPAERALWDDSSRP